ncbi:helix-turn-helix domain-containing protein [Streptomyces sp. NBC_01390]|uniref:helix-turn-helix transcriptional regulator n=1 Tax=Streptomyces sp. NBC_01390 TaxID=2903850 RepID=UPI0032506EAB
MPATSHRRRAPKDELLPLSDVLVELGITRPTWYRWRDRGYGPEARRTQSGRICVRRSVLDAFKDEMEIA